MVAKDDQDVLALAKKQVAEYLVAEYKSVKSLLLKGKMSPLKMTACQQAGMFIVVFGTDGALHKLETMPAEFRAAYNKRWPQLLGLLKQVNTGGN